MIFTFILTCGPDERFAAGAFRSQVGKVIDVKTPLGDFPGTIVSAEVGGDGGMAEIGIEVDPDAIPDNLTVEHWSRSFAAWPGDGPETKL